VVGRGPGGVSRPGPASCAWAGPACYRRQVPVDRRGGDTPLRSSCGAHSWPATHPGWVTLSPNSVRLSPIHSNCGRRRRGGVDWTAHGPCIGLASRGPPAGPPRAPPWAGHGPWCSPSHLHSLDLRLGAGALSVRTSGGAAPQTGVAYLIPRPRRSNRRLAGIFARRRCGVRYTSASFSRVDRRLLARQRADGCQGRLSEFPVCRAGGDGGQRPGWHFAAAPSSRHTSPDSPGVWFVVRRTPCCLPLLAGCWLAICPPPPDLA